MEAVMIGAIRIREQRGELRAWLRLEGRVLAGPSAGRLLGKVREALGSGVLELVVDLSRIEAIDGAVLLTA